MNRVSFILAFFVFLESLCLLHARESDSGPNLPTQIEDHIPSTHTLCARALRSINRLSAAGRAAITTDDLERLLGILDDSISGSQSILDRSVMAVRADYRGQISQRWVSLYQRRMQIVDQLMKELKQGTATLDAIADARKTILIEALKLVTDQIHLIIEAQNGVLPFQLDDPSVVEAWMLEAERKEGIPEIMSLRKPIVENWSSGFRTEIETRPIYSIQAPVADSLDRWLLKYDPLTFVEDWAKSQPDRYGISALQMTFTPDQILDRELIDAFREAKRQNFPLPPIMDNMKYLDPKKEDVEAAVMLGISLQAALHDIVRNPNAVWYKSPYAWNIALPDYQIEIHTGFYGQIENVRIHFRTEKEILENIPRDKSLERLAKELAQSTSPQTQEDTLGTEAPESPEFFNLVPAFENFLASLEAQFPHLSSLFYELRLVSSNFPEVQESPKWKSTIKRLVREEADPIIVQFVLDSMVKRMNLRPLTSGAAGEDDAETQLLNDLISEEAFSPHLLASNQIYSFKFLDTQRVGQVRFTPRALKFMKEHRYRATWIAMFLKGPVESQGRNGLKRLKGNHLDFQWEIKILGHGHDRIGVHFDEDTKIWTFVREFE